MSLSTTRRATTVRSLAGTVLAAALIVPAATACSSTPDAPSTTAATTPAAPAATAPAAATPSTPAAPATPTGATGATGAPGAQGTAAPAAPPASPRPTAAAPAPATTAKGKPSGRSQPLVDGSTAEVQDLGNQNYRARIVHNGDVLATLETHDGDAGLDANDMFVVLSADGTVHSWMGGGHQGPGTFQLAGGWTAKVTKVGELHYRAQVLGNENAVEGTMDANQQDRGAVANGIYIVLTAGGEISAHA
ncbi:hypothetical protein [Streptomyces sp. NRRL S-350]|uniref:hypothetical protein n=1 Tax=Streptomyces sp. NRRL S-350 TaxID=1463902 RepID=UPI0004C16CBF|nr:hypothetical protein [Streptomyces sp. NRRL S-350]